MAEYTIFAFKNGMSSVRRQLYRKIYGYSAEGVKYPGLLSKYNGLKLGAGAIIVRSDCKQAFEDLMKQLQVEFFMLAVQGDELLLNGNNNMNNNLSNSKS